MAQRPQTPPEHIPQTHWRTPTRVALRTGLKLIHQNLLDPIRSNGLTKKQFLATLGVSSTTADRIAKSERTRLTMSKETRGRKPILTARHLRQLERMILGGGFEDRALTFEYLANEIDIKVSTRIIRRAFQHLNYRRYMAYKRSYVAPNIATKRVEFARKMLVKYPTAEHWKSVRFSDETHLRFGALGRTWVIRKPEEKTCSDCVQITRYPKEKDKKRLHAWAVVGWGYKSKLYFYNNNNSNGKMDQKTYIKLLEAECANFPAGMVLEEDNDSGHGPSPSNIVRTWKKRHNLNQYFNCAYSPDLAPIKNAWRVPKAALRKYAHWDDEIIREVAVQAWEGWKQESINKLILSMPARLKRCIEAKGQMTAY